LITYVGVHRGSLAGEAELIALSADPELVGDVAGRLLRGEQPEAPGFDPILGPLHTASGPSSAPWRGSILSPARRRVAAPTSPMPAR
jgi:hypothetical protein